MHSQPVESESLLTRDVSKRKRVNRSARLKQCKLDARREQWLSQGKRPTTPPEQGCSPNQSPKSADGFMTGGDSDAESCVINHDDLWDGGSSMYNTDTVSRNSISSQGERNECPRPGSSSPVQAPVVLDPPARNDDEGGKHKAGRHQQQQQQQQKSKRKSSGRVNDCDKPGSDGLLVLADAGIQTTTAPPDEDDWEAAADALTCQINLNNNEPASELQQQRLKGPASGILDTHHKSTTSKPGGPHQHLPSAWKANDVLRPATLPRPASRGDGILPLPSVPPLSVTGAGGTAGVVWGGSKRQQEGLIKTPAPEAPMVAPSCPICAEELDSTDSSFQPCVCGFRLCLFCYHRIAAEDGRCPGCRKGYHGGSDSLKALRIGLRA